MYSAHISHFLMNLYKTVLIVHFLSKDFKLCERIFEHFWVMECCTASISLFLRCNYHFQQTIQFHSTIKHLRILSHCCGVSCSRRQPTIIYPSSHINQPSFPFIENEAILPILYLIYAELQKQYFSRNSTLYLVSGIPRFATYIKCISGACAY